MRSLQIQVKRVECCKQQREALKQVLVKLLQIRHPSPQEAEEINRIKQKRAQLKQKILFAEQVFGLAT